MKQYFSALSRKQILAAASGILVLLATVIFSLMLGKSSLIIPPGGLTADLSMREIAPVLEVTPENLARELGLSIDSDKSIPLRRMGVSDRELNEVVGHLAGHTDSKVKYLVYAALSLWGLLVLVYIGRPEKSTLKERGYWYPRAIYIATLFVSLSVAGFYFGKSPNPMEGVVKVFKSMVGLYPDPAMKVAALVFFAVFAVVGNKLICGWGCPFGALQELLYMTPFFKRIQARKIPFKLSNSIRLIIFLIVLAVLFGIVGGKKGLVLYHFLNPFNLFNLDAENFPVLATIIAALFLSLPVYRPFCSFICPFGLISWFLEKISFYRVRVDLGKCTRCMSCVNACPTFAARDKIDDRWPGAECFSCMRCLSRCPVDAIKYERAWFLPGR